jgi:hypothetical protein
MYTLYPGKWKIFSHLKSDTSTFYNYKVNNIPYNFFKQQIMSSVIWKNLKYDKLKVVDHTQSNY